MRRQPHERLRELRFKKGYKTQKQFLAHAKKYGYVMNFKRYGGIERGDVNPTLTDVITICRAMEISSDTWLFGHHNAIDTRMLDEAEAKIVRDLVMGLLTLR